MIERRLWPIVPPVLLIWIGLALTAPRVAQARKYTLDELLEMARQQNPGIHAAADATAAMQAQLTEAHRNWYPQGDFTSFVVPVPRVICQGPTNPMGPMGPGGEGDCVTTNASPSHSALTYLTQFAGAWSRTDLKLVQPIFDFGKIHAGVVAAEAGVAATEGKAQGTRAEVELNVRRAYWGLKLAREVRDMLEEGEGYLDSAQKKIEKDLAEGSGNATVTDRLRLRTVRTEVAVRLSEAQRQEEVARSGLRALLGPGAPADLDVDDADFEPLEVAARPIGYYEEQARLSRPEVHALDFAVKAKRALADLEHRKLYPDLVLIGTASLAYAPTIDSPQNAFANNPFNGIGAGLAAAVRLPLDFGPKLARGDRTRAEAAEIEAHRQEALGGIDFEVRKAYLELSEAQSRLTEVTKGEKAGKAWVAAVTQNFAVGLADARDLSDALQQSFKMRTFALQAIYDLNVSAAALSRATGTSVP
ncbi:MAG TPA: TolC family protein [Polyangia bacterium]|nr:TolC family protein [Polyangia bacterium]